LDNHELAIELRLLREEVRALRPDANRVGPVTSSTALITNGSGVTLGRLYMRFRRTHPKGRPWQLIRGLLRPFVLRFWRVPAASLTVAAWDEHIVKRRSEPTRNYRAGKKLSRGGRPPAATTLNLERMRARQLLNFGVDEGLLPKNPLAKVKRLKARKGRDTRLTSQQFATLYANAHVLGEERAPKFRALVSAMCDAMMRIGEARRVRRDRIALDGTYEIPASHAKNGEARVVAFTSRCLTAFADVPEHPGSPYVIPSQRGKGMPYDASALRDWFYEVSKHCGLDAVAADGDVRLKPHDMRATGASIADERGASLRRISNALGHKSVAVTARYIRSATNESALDMARVMEGSKRRGAQKSTHDLDRLLDVSSTAVVQKSS
jgi:integrase